MNYFMRELLSKRETNVDAINVGAFLALIAMIVYTGIQIFSSPALFSGSTFAFGCASLLGAMGGAKGFREALTPKEPADVHEPSEQHGS